MNKMQKKLGSRHRPHRERSTVGRLEKCLPSGKTVGCITGVFRFFARQQHNSSTKRLPSGGRKDQFRQSPPRSLMPPPPEKRMKVEETTAAAVSLKQMLSLAQKHSCESPRSPTLPPEIRNPDTIEVTDSPRCCRRATLMERLMGLDDDDVPVGPPESSKEKWRKIVVTRTADSCDSPHLESLKRIIDAAVDRFSRSEDCSSEEQPSPVSVLDPVSLSKISADKSKQRKQSMLQPTEEKNEEPRRSTNESIKRSGPVEDFVPASKAAEVGRRRLLLRRPRRTMSQAMVETVCEVSERVSWEERKEAMGVVVALERGLFGDLVEDLGRDLALHCRTRTTIRRTCRKRLHF